MNCEEIQELMGAYVLGAVPDAEAAMMREHMKTCRRHDVDLAELRIAARQMAASVEPVEAPTRLRSRVLAAIDADRGGEPPLRRPAARAMAARTFAGPRNAWWMASAAAIVIAGLLAWNIVLLRRGGDDLGSLSRQAHVVATLRSDGVSGTGSVVYFPEKKQALVVGDGLPSLEPSTSTYQMWEIADGQPKSIGLMQADASGHAVAVVAFEQVGHTFAITIEPAGGSDQPTSKPVLNANL
jgi:anti-sigma-K factor RskA